MRRHSVESSPKQLYEELVEKRSPQHGKGSISDNLERPTVKRHCRTFAQGSIRFGK